LPVGEGKKNGKGQKAGPRYDRKPTGAMGGKGVATYFKGGGTSPKRKKKKTAVGQRRPYLSKTSWRVTTGHDKEENRRMDRRL